MKQFRGPIGAAEERQGVERAAPITAHAPSQLIQETIHENHSLRSTNIVTQPPITTVTSSPRKGFTPLGPCDTFGSYINSLSLISLVYRGRCLTGLTASTHAKRLGLDLVLAGRITEALHHSLNLSLCPRPLLCDKAVIRKACACAGEPFLCSSCS